MVDWQTVGIGYGPVDVAYFVGAGLVLPAESDSTLDAALVARYGDRLERHLGKSVDRDALWLSYRLGSASGYVMAVVASQLVIRTERGDAMFIAMAQRHARQMRRLRLAELV